MLYQLQGLVGMTRHYDYVMLHWTLMEMTSVWICVGLNGDKNMSGECSQCSGQTSNQVPPRYTWKNYWWLWSAVSWTNCLYAIFFTFNCS